MTSSASSSLPLPIGYPESNPRIEQIFDNMNHLLLQDGHIGRMFGNEEALVYFHNFLKRPLEDYCVHYDAMSLCFFIPGDGDNPRTILDHYRGRGLSIIRQKLWQPRSETDRGRYVLDATIQPIIIFRDVQGYAGGLTVERTAKGDCKDFIGCETFAPLGDKASTQIRLQFDSINKEGINPWKPWKRQVQTRTQANPPRPISLRTFMKHLGRSVQEYFERKDIEPLVPPLSSTPLTSQNIYILGAVHSSVGGWQPILAYDMRSTW